MIARSCVLLAAFLLIASGLGAKDDKKDDKDKLQGEWTVASMELRGKIMSEEQRKDWRLVVKGDEWLQTSKSDNRQELKMTFKFAFKHRVNQFLQKRGKGAAFTE